MSTFSELNLDPSISKAIIACGYTTPTPIQMRSIPDILEGKDLVASAQTGTGKTAAFVLPALHRLSMDKKAFKPRVLILTPTRELAAQITQAAGKYGKFVRFNMASLVGGMPYRQQLRDLSRAVDMIVATPGRLMDHMENKRIDLSGIEMLILDEADRMLDMGFIDDVQAIARATPETRQTLLFSATVDGNLSRIVKHLLKNPVRIDLSQEKMSPAQITQELYMTDSPQHKSRLLQHFLDNENIFKAIIFTGTKIGADKLAGQLEDEGYSAAALHGDLKQNVRNRTIEKLRSGRIQFLVATDVAARGIDIADMTHVINYDLPRFCEDYVHRIGRTGRAGKTGKAISFALPCDVRHVTRIERFIGQRLPECVIEGLEPNPKLRQQHSDGPKKKFGKKGFGKPFNKGEGSDRKFGDKPSFGRSNKKFGDKPSNGRSSLKYSDRASEGGAGRKFGDRNAEGGAGRKFSDRGGEGRKFGDRNNDGAFGRKFADRSNDGASNRRFGDRPEGGARNFGDRSNDAAAKRGFSNRPSEGGAGRKFGDRSNEGGSSRKFGDRSEGGAGRKFGDRSEGGAGRKFGDRSEGGAGRNFGDRSEGGAGRKFGDRSNEGGANRRFGDRSEGGSSRKYSDRSGDAASNRGFSNRSSEGGAGRKFGDRSNEGGAGRKFGERSNEGGSNRRFGERSNEGSSGRKFGERSEGGAGRKFGERSGEGRKKFGDRPSEGGAGRKFGDKPSENGSRRKFGEKFGNGAPGKNFGDKPRSGGAGKKFGDKPQSTPRYTVRASQEGVLTLPKKARKEKSEKKIEE